MILELLVGAILATIILALTVVRTRDIARLDARHTAGVEASAKEHAAFLREFRQTGRRLIEEFSYTVELRMWEHETQLHGIERARPLPVPGEQNTDGG